MERCVRRAGAHSGNRGRRPGTHIDTLRFISAVGKHEAFSQYLEHLEASAPPYAVAAFNTKQEAEAWLRAHPNPARRAWVTIASKFYLAAYHPNFNHRALYPLSMADGYRDDDDT